MARGRSLRQSQTAEADERLLIEAAQRSPARFDDLYDLYFDRIYTYVAWRAASRDETEDIVSEVFHKALANLRRFEWRGAPFSAWLYRIAANEITDHAERVGRERAIEPPPEAEEANQEEAHDRAKVFALVRELPADQRKVLDCVSWRRRARARWRRCCGAARAQSNNCSFAVRRTCGR